MRCDRHNLWRADNTIYCLRLLIVWHLSCWYVPPLTGILVTLCTSVKALEVTRRDRFAKFRHSCVSLRVICAVFRCKPEMWYSCNDLRTMCHTSAMSLWRRAFLVSSCCFRWVKWVGTCETSLIFCMFLLFAQRSVCAWTPMKI